MHQLGQYITTLTVVSLISGILLSLLQDGTIRSLLRICCGIFLTVTALSPFVEIEIPAIPEMDCHYLTEGSRIADMAEQSAQTEMKRHIKALLEEYIYDMAQKEGADIRATICLDSSGIPESVQLHGMASDPVQIKLQELITNDLGIRKENQEWIGPEEENP